MYLERGVSNSNPMDSQFLRLEAVGNDKVRGGLARYRSRLEVPNQGNLVSQLPAQQGRHDVILVGNNTRVSATVDQMSTTTVGRWDILGEIVPS